MALGKRVKEAREFRGLDRTELAQSVGWSPQAISTLERRDSKKSDYTAKIAAALNVSVNWLITGEGTMTDINGDISNQANPSSKYIPVKGSAQMGDDGYWVELDYLGNGGNGYLEVNNVTDSAYAIRAVGESMFPAIRSGWYIAFEPNNELVAGEYVHVVLKDGRNMIKEFVSCQNGILTLISVNGMKRLSFNECDVEVINPFVEIQPPSRLIEEIPLLEPKHII